MPSQLPQRYIGDTTVSAIGLGCMNLSIPGPSGPLNEDSVFKVLTEAADLGMTFWDTSSAYGDNEVLIGKWFQKTGRRSEIFLATKFGFRIVDGKIDLCSKPDYVRELCDKSLQRLQTDYIDLFYQHRVDPETPIEYTVETMTQLKSEGKIHNLGLSECSSQTLRRASKVHPIAAAQMEYSPFSLEIESPQTEFLKTARELGVKIVAYAPLGRGLLAGSFKTIEDIDPSRKILPRFSAENFKSNLQLGDAFKMLAKEKNCTTGQLTLAWILAQGPDFIPIPGTKHIEFLRDNIGGLNVDLSHQEEERIRNLIREFGSLKGDRYPQSLISCCFGDSKELEGEEKP